MTSLTFYGGVNEIGGNKILLEDKDSRIFLDFGMSFSRRADFFDGFMKPRTAVGIKDLIEFNLVPNLEGIYRTDLMKLEGNSKIENTIDAVILSHPHEDHANYISFLHEDIPIYMGETCKLVLQAIDERSQRNLEKEILSFKPRDDSNAEPIERKIQTFRTGDKFKIGSLEIEPIHVDHSVPGAYGFIIHSSEGTIVYTGDLRMHGTKASMTEDFIKKASENKPIALISEGTRIDIPRKNESEEKVYNESSEHVKNTNGVVFADFNFKDVDRLRTFYNLTKENDRKLVVNVNDTPYLKFLSEDPKLKVPNTNDDNILIFKPQKSSYKKFEKEYFDKENIVTAAELGKQQQKIVCAFSYWDFSSLIDMKPNPNSLYIHSLSEPFNEEMEIDAKRPNNWIEHFGMKNVQIHCSGHAFAEDIADLVMRIDAKQVFPIHCEAPKEFRLVSESSVLIQENQKYNI